jgi:hypothetical protein
MLGESRLNVYILGDSLSPRQRERIQAQVQTALQSVPEWALNLLDRKIEDIGVRNLPLIIEPVPDDSAEARSLTFGDLDGRPSAKLIPRLSADAIVWSQDRRYLVLKAVAYLASPPAAEHEFWARWSKAVESDGLRSTASGVNAHWGEATDRDLLIEMFAAYALSEAHSNWSVMPAVRGFFDGWR